MSHTGCNVNNAEGRPSCWAGAGCLSRLLPYTWGSHTKWENGYTGGGGAVCNDPEVLWTSLGDTTEGVSTLSLLL